MLSPVCLSLDGLLIPARTQADCPKSKGSGVLQCVQMHIGWYLAKPERVLCQNCVTYPRNPGQTPVIRSRDCYLSLPLDALSAAFSPVAFRVW